MEPKSTADANTAPEVNARNSASRLSVWFFLNLSSSGQGVFGSSRPDLPTFPRAWAAREGLDLPTYSSPADVMLYTSSGRLTARSGAQRTKG